MQATQCEIVGLGVSVLDIVTLVGIFPANREVQRAHDMVIGGGGPVATAMVALARLGIRTAMLDVLGDDWRGKIIREELLEEGVDTEHVRIHPGCISSTANILVRKEDGARSVTFLPGNIPDLLLTESDRPLIESAKYLHVNGRHWDACLQAVTWAREAHVQVSFDGGADRYRPEFKQLVPLTDVCIVAKDFAEKYTLEKDLRSAAKLLAAGGPRIVVITDGVKGSWIHTHDHAWFHQPAFMFTETVDTTGCGDSFHGAFLFGLLREYSLEKSAAFASAVAGLNSQHLGGREGLPSFEEVCRLLASHGVSV